MGLIIPKNNADASTLDATMKVYYDANDWVANEDLIDRLSSMLIQKGIEDQQKEPQSYTKKTQVPAYFGFIEWEDPTNNQSKRRLTDAGRSFYEARLNDDKAAAFAILVNALKTNTFGRNVVGCDSDSDIEAPNVFVKASLLLGSLKNNEFAAILGMMELEKLSFGDAVCRIRVNHLKQLPLELDSNARKWNDPKPITALKNWGFLNQDGSLNGEVIDFYYEDILALRTKNTEAVRFVSPNESDIDNCGLSEVVKPYLSAIRTKPFLLLSGISGTGKSRIVRRLAQATTTEALEKAYDKDFVEGSFEANRWNIHKPANFEIIQVKPNWHNSMDLVGYQTNIPEPHYVFMPFAEFIAKAWLHKEIPFFLCLDEMNLAPVEEYFAEFLSAIESRSKNGGKYETDPIIKPFKDFGEKVCEQMLVDLFPGKTIANATEEPLKSVIERFKKKGLTLPENLIVIGTVNMDETTFSFSRKVLDRAMSFEMNEVDYDDFMNDDADIISAPLTDDEKALLTNRTIKAQDIADEIEAGAVINYLKAVNAVLDNTPFKLGYRAANEAMLYVSASQKFGQGNVATALDEFTLMKILSRIEGDAQKLKTDDGDSILDKLGEVIDAHLTSDDAELKSAKKLTHMKKQLGINHFVSYWE